MLLAVTASCGGRGAWMEGVCPHGAPGSAGT